MAGLINSDILRNPNIPLNRMSATPPSVTPYKGKSPATPADFGEYTDPQGNSYLPGEAGYPNQPNPNGSYGNAQGNNYLPGEPGYPGATGTSYLPGELGYAPASAPAAKPDWDAWANTPWNPGEKTPNQNAIDQIVLGTKQVGAAAKPFTPNWDTWANTPWSQSEADANAATGKSIGDAIATGAKRVGETFNPYTTAKPVTTPDTKGALSDPGVGEVGFDKHEGDFIKPGDEAVQKFIDLLGNRQSLGKPDLDAWYDREWKRAQGSLNAQAAARGMHGSTDAMRMLHQSRESLAADQAKEMADFAMKSFNADTDRYKLAAALQGEVSQQDLQELNNYMDAAFGAQRLEEGRVGGKVDDLFGAFDRAFSGVIKGWDDLLDSDKEIMQQIIMAGPAPATERAAQEARLSEQGKAAWAQLGKLGFGGPAAGATGANV